MITRSCLIKRNILYPNRNRNPSWLLQKLHAIVKLSSSICLKYRNPKLGGLAPIVVDLHNLSPGTNNPSLVLGFAGTPDDVRWQLSKAAGMGFAQPSSLDHEKRFFTEGTAFQKVSVLPSRALEVIRSLNNAPFIARAGNGVIYHRSQFRQPSDVRPTKLEDRLKNEFDPKHILPELPL